MTAPLHAYAARSADRDPEATAVVLGDVRLDYGTLVRDARRLARLLVERGVRPGDRVALMAPKAPATVMAMHAVLEAGAAYVPVDLASPPPRVAMILEAAAPSAIVAGAGAERLLAGIAVPVVSLEAREWAGADDGPLGLPCRDDSLAHILFTSGSTGVPKGVQVTHAMASAFVEWGVRHYGIGADERLSGHTPLHFDLSTFDVYGTMLAGAQLHQVPTKAGLLPAAMAAFIRDSELTQWFSVPSVLTYIARAGVIADGDFPALRRVLFCGEAMPATVLAEWMRRVPHPLYSNLYGPTETAIASSYYDVPAVPEDETEDLPIGYPCDGEEVVVLDEAMEPVPPGEIGELWIGGIALSPGYWRDEEKTAAAFVNHPRDPSRRLYRTGDLGRVDDEGRLRFVGRVDSQIKHRGYRIELGEIEAALSAVGGIGECAVVAIETDAFGGTEICCAYTAPDGGLEPPQVRGALARALPAYMLPTRWMTPDVLPKNANGKIDRRALRESFAEAAAAPAR